MCAEPISKLWILFSLRHSVYSCKNCETDLVKSASASRYNTLMAVIALLLYSKAKKVPDLNMALFLVVLFSVIAMVSLLLANNAIEVAKREADEDV